MRGRNRELVPDNWSLVIDTYTFTCYYLVTGVRAALHVVWGAAQELFKNETFHDLSNEELGGKLKLIFSPENPMWLTGLKAPTNWAQSTN